MHRTARWALAHEHSVTSGVGHRKRAHASIPPKRSATRNADSNSLWVEDLDGLLMCW